MQFEKVRFIHNFKQLKPHNIIYLKLLSEHTLIFVMQFINLRVCLLLCRKTRQSNV